MIPLVETFENPRHGMPQELSTELVKAIGELGDVRAITPLLRAGVAVAAPELGLLEAREAVPELMAALEQARTPRDAEELAEVLAQLEGACRAAVAACRTASSVAAGAPCRRPATGAHGVPGSGQHLRAILPELSSGDAVSVAEALVLMGCAEGFKGFAQALAGGPHHRNASAVAYACKNLRGPQAQALLLDCCPASAANTSTTSVKLWLRRALTC